MHADLIGITPELGTVLERLNRAGGRPVIVGGSVRDALLGTPSNDVDVECYSLSYRDLTEALADLGRVDLVGASFGVLKYTTDTLSVDISLPRRDNKVGVGHRGFDVDAREHAGTPDVGIDHGFDAVVLELPRQVDNIMAGELGPAIHRHLAVLGIEADNDVAAKRSAGIL